MFRRLRVRDALRRRCAETIARFESLPLTDPNILPSRATERLLVVALTVSVFGIALNTQVFGALAPFLRAEVGLSKQQIGWLISAGWWATALSSLALLPIVDRVGRRVPILFGLVGFAIASGLHLVTEDIALLITLRIATGFFGGAAFTIASAAVADLVPYERRGAAMVVFNLSIFLAVPIGLPIAVGLAAAGVWNGVFWLQLATSLFAFVWLWRHLPASLGRGGQARIQWGVLRLPHVVPALLSVALYSGAFATVTQFLGVWLDASRILGREQQWSLWLILGLVSAVGTFALARFTDRFGKRRFVLWTSAVVGVGLAVLSGVESGVALLLIGVPVAACTAARSGAMVALVSGLAPSEQRGTLMVLRVAVLNLGMAAIVALGGWVYEAEGFGALLWVAVVAVTVSTWLVARHVREVGA